MLLNDSARLSREIRQNASPHGTGHRKPQGLQASHAIGSRSVCDEGEAAWPAGHSRNTARRAGPGSLYEAAASDANAGIARMTPNL